MRRSDIYKVKEGSKVMIRTDLINNQIYGTNTFVDRMSQFKGKWVTVEDFYYPIADGGLMKFSDH
jgi:hypothetical protein